MFFVFSWGFKLTSVILLEKNSFIVSLGMSVFHFYFGYTVFLDIRFLLDSIFSSSALDMLPCCFLVSTDSNEKPANSFIGVPSTWWVFFSCCFQNALCGFHHFYYGVFVCASLCMFLLQVHGAPSMYILMFLSNLGILSQYSNFFSSVHFLSFLLSLFFRLHNVFVLLYSLWILSFSSSNLLYSELH